MGWLGKLFGGGASVDSLRKAIEQMRFADARLMAETLSVQTLAEPEAAEVEQLRIAAGDGLARLNYAEALGMRNNGDAELADEHLQLALGQVCSAALRLQIEQALADVPIQPEIAAPVSAGSACGSCGPQPTSTPETEERYSFDAASQVELVLTSYPQEFVERYRQKGATFLQAFLLSHSGDDAAALPLWEQVDGPERDELYWFEIGAALARSGNLPAARSGLEKSLQLNGELQLATEALVPVLFGLGEAGAAQKHLQQMLDRGQDPAFCHGQLAMLCLQQKQPEAAVAHIHQALAAGISDPSFLPLAATVLEQSGALADAEAVLQRIPGGGGGCGGGLSLPLAEFLLRHKRDLGRVLDTFNAACRQEPDNPRWQLRVAQTYLARNWQKDGLKLLQRVVGDPRLGPELQQEAELLLADQQA